MMLPLQPWSHRSVLEADLPTPSPPVLLLWAKKKSKREMLIIYICVDAVRLTKSSHKWVNGNVQRTDNCLVFSCLISWWGGGGRGGGVSVNRRFTLRRCEKKAVNCRKCSNIFDNVRWHFDSVNKQKQTVHLNVSVVTFATQEAFPSSFSLAF